MSKYRALLTHSGPSHELVIVAICTLGGWHPELQRPVMHTATVIASRDMIPFERARGFLFQRHSLFNWVGR